MAQRTVYVKASDAPLWDQAKKELGKSMSSLISDCLRKTLTAKSKKDARSESHKEKQDG